MDGKRKKVGERTRPSSRGASTRRGLSLEVAGAVTEETSSEQRNALLKAATDYVLERGLQDLSLRAIAAELGTSHRILIYYFQSADGFWEAVVQNIRHQEQRLRLELAAVDWSGIEEAVLELWKHYTSESYLPIQRVVFEIYGRAIRNPERFRGFLDDMIGSWVTSLEDGLSKRSGLSISEVRTRLRLSIAVFRGLQLDLLTTGDRKATTAALRLFARSIARLPTA